MDKQRDVLRQAAVLAALTAAGVLLMWAVYFVAGRFDTRVLLGGALGWALAVGNFLVLSITVSNAVDRAARGDGAAKAQLEIQLSGVVRPLVLAGIYYLLFRSGACELLSTVLPLVIAQVAVKFVGFFCKDGGAVS